MSLESLLEDFALFDDWEDRYRYIIELGHKLTPLTEEEHNDTTKVSGCVSQVWLVCEGTAEEMHFRGDSDAHIVRGLIAIVLIMYSGKSAQEILSIDAHQIFSQLGMNTHLTPQRSNGFHSMTTYIYQEAERALASR